jgi:hypothetical protein
MKCSCYSVFNHSVLLCPSLYSTAPSFYFAPPAYDWLQTTFIVPYKPSARTYRKHIPWSLSTVVCRHCLHGNVFTESLPRNMLHKLAVLLLRACITLATTDLMAQQYLHGANTPQYLIKEASPSCNSYSGGSRFEYQLAHRLHSLEYSVVFLSSPGKCRISTLN